MYELHITVEEHPTPEQAVAFTDVCTEMLGKCLYIQLANGDFPLQLMISRRSDFNDDATAVKWAQTQAEMIRQLGWNVVRIKVEAPFSAKTYGPKLHAMYTEAHWKFLISEGDLHRWRNGIGLREWLDIHPELRFKHSWNVMHPEVHYLTARIADKDSMKEQAYLDQRGADIRNAGFTVQKQHYERVVYDDRLSLDSGWSK